VGDDRVYDYEIFDRFTERWPKAGDRLLSPGHDSFLAQEPAERNYRLLQGYKRAGDILVQTALATRCDRNNLVFPALFNYRHYIELAMKAIIEDHGRFAGVALDARNHRLPELWKTYLKIATAFHHDCSDQATIAVGDCIRELDIIDGNSTTFRYARTRKDETPDLPTDGIDLVQLHDAMNGIENFFECADMAFTHEAERLAEISQEYDY